MSTILDEIEVQRKKRILATGESFDEHYVYCPYCASVFREVYDDYDVPINGEEEIEIQCRKCDRHFAVSGSVRYSTRRLK